ncbi:hypothetical protein pdam_00013446 [Pocillopora damicornis]|uniref:Uncharacterized protein n=1 Tax=Pocillopora damicornis TaxID=46731 RepID=A0A3M6TEK9_POCDA|nr:hypothetical protein pdam_00013446 [Pocillopora damicornis]
MHSRPIVKTKRSKHSVYSDRELWSLLTTSLEKKKANKRRRDPDMLRNAVLELTVQKLNEEITDRCMKKVKRRKLEDSYEWQESPDGLGWNMTASYQDDEDLLGKRPCATPMVTCCQVTIEEREKSMVCTETAEVTGKCNAFACSFKLNVCRWLLNCFLVKPQIEELK